MSEWGYWQNNGVWKGHPSREIAVGEHLYWEQYAPERKRGPVQFGKDPNPFETKPAASPPAKDDVNQPAHYTSHPSGIECIQVVEHYPFNLGNAIKYIWRAGLKTPDPIKDLRKAAFYIDREIKRLEKK